MRKTINKIQFSILLGSAIREIRKGQRISQSGLSRASGITQGYLSKLEQGKVSVDFYDAIRLGHELGCGLDELVEMVR